MATPVGKEIAHCYKNDDTWLHKKEKTYRKFQGPSPQKTNHYVLSDCQKMYDKQVHRLGKEHKHLQKERGSVLRYEANKARGEHV